ncbi:aminotransferase class I and II [Pyxidicoccus fallax]|uniref:Aminotransferase class I and II n=1 Tax=Pyxidicoccus fallax TaxID=394095 RepID=A0A848LBS8_9BACT|nr:HipA family kinase [Pyxidicoccus fallax]NMO16500.1 aminotransferase class I and II [Pyxidicoccus fallax]NPC77438.1 aminotransferase class I and II [Pyxidicoccus fallax]
MLRTVTATRYVTSLREGGSLPAIIEADDAGLYVVKFRGAGQGAKALIAELIAGELARAVGLRVPELVLVELDPALGRNEPDSEIRELLKASAGLNLGLDYLPGSVTFDPLAGPFPSAEEASTIVGFDAYVTNVDRTPKNPNMLSWHKDLWLIDHGAALYFHHSWEDWEARSQSRFGPIKDHVLLPWATALAAQESSMRERLTREVVERTVAAIPEEWLTSVESPFPTAHAHRAAYVTWLSRRVEALPAFLEEAARARAQLV